MLRKVKLYLVLCFSIFSFCLIAQETFSLVSWNIANLGKSKNVQELTYIAKQIKNYDIIAIQEVVAGYGGAQAVARLVDILNRMGNKWEFVVSNPTSSVMKSSERYAFIWKTSKVRLKGKPFLDAFYATEIDREPYIADFHIGKKTISIVNFHAVPKKKTPEKEIKYLKFFPEKYPDKQLIFCGDFNTSQSNNVFNPLKKMGYTPALIGKKTTIRMKCIEGDCLASEYDNIFYPKSLEKKSAGVIEFQKEFSDMRDARKISDHLPIYAEFSF